MLTNTQMQMMIDSAAKAYTYGASNPAPTGTTFVRSIDDSKTGAHAQIYRINGTNEYAVAFTGTQPNIGGQDLYSDFGHHGMNQWRALQPSVQSFLAGEGAAATAVHFTGESLGGALAQYATYDMAQGLQAEGKQVTMTTLNALGGQAGIVERDGSVNAAKLAGVDATHLFAVSQGGNPDGVSRLGDGHLGGQTYRVDLNQELGFEDRHTALRGIASTFNWSMAAVDTPNYVHIPLGTEITQFVGNLAYAGGVNGASGYLRAAGGLLTAMATIPKAERDQFIDMLSPNNADAKRIGDYVFGHPLTKGGSILTGIALSLLGVIAENIPKLLEKFDGYSYFGWSPQALVISTFFTAAARWIQPVVGGRDPLTFDLNGNGIETVPINSANPILFDHTGSGMKVATGWVAPSDGFLVLDRNANGAIDNGTELFGDSTPLASGGNAADGFAALAQEDTNADGLVNALDARFANLRIWQDLNQDGISFVDANGNGVLDAGETSELKTLAELNIASIKVAKIENSQMLANGNEIADLGSYTRTDGSAGGMGITSGLADVNLASDTFHRMFVDTVPLDPLVATLPDMQGSGVVRDLREAASTSSTFLTTLAQYAQFSTSTVQHQLLDTLVSEWGATSGMADMQTRATAHGYTLTTNLDAVHFTRLTALEQFNGRGLYRLPFETGVGVQTVTGMSVVGLQINITMSQAQISLLDQAYSALKNSVYDALLPQTRLKPYLDQIGLTLTNGNFTLDVSGVLAAFQNKMAVDVETGLTDLVDFNRNTAKTLNNIDWANQGWDLFGNVLNTTPMTTTLLSALNDVGLQVEGQAGYSPSGTSKDDIIIGTNLNSTLNGGAGNDVLFGMAGNDALNGGYGSDTLIGGAGDDTLNVNAPPYSNTWNTYNYNSYEATGNVLEGGAGNDALNGGGGSDTYRFNLGDGSDTITEVAYNNNNATDTAVDKIELGAGIVPADITIVRSGNNLLLKFATAGDQITIANWYGSTGAQIEQVVFADGTVWDKSALHDAGLVMHGTAGADAITGIAGETNTLYGEGGNDTLTGQDTTDYLDGGAGNDALNGGYGSDTLIGGAGNDTLTLKLTNKTLQLGSANDDNYEDRRAA